SIKMWSLFVLCCKLFCICLFSTDLIQTAEVPQQVSLTLVELGGNVTLWCPVFREGYFYWYKQTLGHMIQTVATVTFTGQKLSLQLNNTRFKVTGGETQYSLTIRNITKEDEATYFCLIGTAYDKVLSTSPSCRSSRKTESSVQVNTVCTGSDLDQENLIQASFTLTVMLKKKRSCDFSLSKTIHNSSDTGTYYCAVATCGEILFGEGTQVDTSTLVIPRQLGCMVGINCSSYYSPNLITMYYYYRYFSYSYNLQDADRDAVNYAALNFSKRKVPRVKKRESPAECVYSAVRADYHTQRHL
uniref:Ig-like domain-containing protein n=1 Tax=Cyclopterus lumpus TaxID=8103 RepID=A0A8C3A8W0_CYCLU